MSSVTVTDARAVEHSIPEPHYAQTIATEDRGCQVAYMGHCVHVLRADERPLGFLANIFRAISDCSGRSRSLFRRVILPAAVTSAGVMSLGMLYVCGVLALAAIAPQTLLLLATAITVVAVWESAHLAKEMCRAVNCR